MGDGEQQRASEAGPGVGIDPSTLNHVLASPPWLRDLGRSAWLLIGFAGLLVGAVWLLGLLSVIVEPVLVACVVATVAAPGVSWLKRKGVPRAVGAALMLLALVAIAVAVVLLVLGGLVSQRGSIETTLGDGLEKITNAIDDAGIGGSETAKGDIEKALPEVGSALIDGVVEGIAGLTSIVFFLSFLALGVFFLLKDGPGMRRAIDGHLGLPRPVATLVTGEILTSLRRYFAGLTIVAAFNGVVVGLGAWLLDVPLPATIAIVAFVTAYVPYVGAFVSGTFTVVLALADEGPATAVAMLVIFILANGLLQQLVQPIAFGATLDLNPLVVLIVTISGGALFGMVGLILAAPLTSAFVHISRELGRARAASGKAPEPAAPS